MNPDLDELEEIIEELAEVRIDLARIAPEDELGLAVLHLARVYRDTPDGSLHHPIVSNALSDMAEIHAERAIEA